MNHEKKLGRGLDFLLSETANVQLLFNSWEGRHAKKRNAPGDNMTRPRGIFLQHRPPGSGRPQTGATLAAPSPRPRRGLFLCSSERPARWRADSLQNLRMPRILRRGG